MAFQRLHRVLIDNAAWIWTNIPLSPMLLLSLLALTLHSAPALGTLFTDPSQLPRTNYDYVVVGGGVGGGVVASRLAESPGTRVLLIEAGPDNEGLEAVAAPFLCTTLSANTFVDWNYTTVPQNGLLGRVLSYPRGRLLGGSSSINYMDWTRGSRDDYDRLANISGDPGWSWNALEPIFKKIERIVPPADGHNTTGEIDESVHGHKGPLGISVVNTLPTSEMIVQATQQLGEFHFNLDFNSGNTIGIGFSQATIRNGSRESSATAYIHPTLAAAASRLDVLINTQVVRILQTGIEHGLPVFRGVRFAASANATVYTVNATTEVILSAGAVATPQLLMLSGIGNATYLSRLGITPTVDLPGVGQRLQDHPILRNVFVANSSAPTNDDIHQNASLAATDLAQWEATRKGPYSSPATTHLGWFRVSDDVLGEIGDTSAGPTSAHYEIIINDGYASTVEPMPQTGRFFTIGTVLVSPSARGAVTLASTNPFDKPIVDPAFFSTAADIRIMREAVKAAKRFAGAPAFKDYIVRPYGAFANTTTDAAIDVYARNGSVSIWHPIGTASIAPFASQDGVVNPDLTVKKTRGLRVVDASVFPFIPAAHTQAGTYAIAERAASLIRATHYDLL
ncbi:GMC oxidoreductase [Auriscalpium vulgare]|uniref:GMC oxidoreductase n=1 Tax=Auriscalpium vulgare TaxID=40419 RepID=A0ACB8RA31_9AGAM|nr:GMC oxidoreductase [Auriscalpium vulgare]